MKDKNQSFEGTTWTCPFCGAQEPVTEEGVRHYGVGHQTYMSLTRLKMMDEREMKQYGYDPNQLSISEDFIKPTVSRNVQKSKSGQLSFI